MSDDNYVAWLRYNRNGDQARIVVCDSDSPGAFKVWRQDPSESRRQALAEKMSCGHPVGCEVCAECGFQADGHAHGGSPYPAKKCAWCASLAEYEAGKSSHLEMVPVRTEAGADLSTALLLDPGEYEADLLRVAEVVREADVIHLETLGANQPLSTGAYHHAAYNLRGQDDLPALIAKAKEQK